MIDMQSFEGTWEVSEELLNIMSLKAWTYQSMDTARMTMLVIVFLQEKMASEKDVWELVVDKAETWLQGSAIGKERLAEMGAEARSIVSNECK